MHEWALAEAIVKSTEQFAAKENLREIIEVTVRIGTLQQVEPHILRFAFSEMKSASLKNTKFRFLKAKTRLKCRVCKTAWQFNVKEITEEKAEAIHFVPEAAHTYIKCPKCGSHDFEIASGRGVWLESVKGVK